MRSTFYGLEIARTGLFTSKIQLDVTGHNIANADTAGYTRQRVQTQALVPPYSNIRFSVNEKAVYGHGVQTILIDQVRDAFLDKQYRLEASDNKKNEVRYNELHYITLMFNQMDDTKLTLTKAIENLFNTLHEVSENPQSISVRSDAMMNAQMMAEQFRTTASQLLDKQKAQNDSVRVLTNEVNQITRSIADLNELIFGFELSGKQANDLRDQRNLLIDNLAELIDINYSYNNEGKLSITVGGETLVSHKTYNEITVMDTPVTNPVDGCLTSVYQVVWAEQDASGKSLRDADGKLIPSTDELTISSGKIKGYIDVRDNNTPATMGIPYIMQQLNTLALSLMTQFNAINSDGWTVPYTDPVTGISYPSRTGVNFFDPATTGASSFYISDDLLKSGYNIAASDEPIDFSADNSQIFNKKNIEKLYKLGERTDIPGIDSSFAGYLEKMTVELADEARYVKQTYSNSLVMMNSIINQRMAISSVSLDEEMTNLIKFQRAYQASSRVINSMDECLDVLMRTGVVGR